MRATNAALANPRIDLLLQRAATPFESFVLGPAATECDIVVKGLVGGDARGWVRLGDGTFMDDLGGIHTDAAVRKLAASEGSLTYTCAPPGAGVRMGVDRDRDAVLDGLDNCPAVGNEDQADSDGDGVGDACAPSPQTAGAARRASDAGHSHGIPHRHGVRRHG